MTMPRWKALLVDDEPLARRTLQLLLEKHPEIDVVGECDHAAAAVDAIRQTMPDLMFIDVQMPGATGFDVIRETGLDVVPVVVFTTAYAEYALAAFEAHALDYLLKPFSDQRFGEVMTRVARALDRAQPASLSTRPRALTIREAGRTLVIPVAEIDWIEAEDYCTRIHAGPRRPLVRRSLQSLIDELAADGFVRTHRSAIVNLAKIRELRPLASGDSELSLADGTTVRVSRSYRSHVDQKLNEHSGSQ